MGTQPMPVPPDVAAKLSSLMMVRCVFGLLGAIYMVAMNTAYGATLGKMALGLKIVKADGSRIGFGTALIRYILEIIFASFTLNITFLTVAFTQKKQGLHDMVAGTGVIKTR